MSIPFSAGFDTNGPIAWDTVRSTFGVSGAQDISDLMVVAGIKKYSFYRPGGIKIDFAGGKAIIDDPDVAAYKWGDWRNYSNDGAFPFVPSTQSFSFLAGATSLLITIPISWQYLNVQQLSPTITHIMTELWREPAKTNFIGRVTTPITWQNEPTIPGHSTTQTQLPSPVGNGPQLHSITINPSVELTYSPLYAETWLSDNSNSQRAHWENFSTVITLIAIYPPKIKEGLILPANLPVGNSPDGNPWAVNGNLLAVDTAATPVCNVNGAYQSPGTAYSFYFSSKLRNSVGKFYIVPITSIALRIQRNDGSFNQAVGTFTSVLSTAKKSVTGTLTSGNMANGDFWELDYSSITWSAGAATLCP